jgi:hypothetical protein
MTEQVQETSAQEKLFNITLVSSYNGQSILTWDSATAEVTGRIIKAYEVATSGSGEVFDFGSGVLVGAKVLQNMILVVKESKE